MLKGQGLKYLADTDGENDMAFIFILATCLDLGLIFISPHVHEVYKQSRVRSYEALLH